MLTREEALIVAYARALIIRRPGKVERRVVVAGWVDATKASGRYYHDLISRAYAICERLGTKTLFSPQVFGWPLTIVRDKYEVTG